MSEITGFHGTKKENVASIIAGNFKVSKRKKKDNHWIGHMELKVMQV